MRNKILLGTGIAAIVAGIGGLFAADNVKKNKGFERKLDQMDFENMYQIVIKIDKKNRCVRTPK